MIGNFTHSLSTIKNPLINNLVINQQKKQQFTLNPEYVHFTLQQHQFKIYFRTFFFVDIFY